MADWKTQVVGAQRGDLEAFDRVVRQFQDMAVGYAYSILQDFSLAEDAAQEAFIQAYYDLAALREPQAFPAWFRRIVFKQCDRLTRRKRLPTVSLDADAELADPGRNPLEVLQQRELQDAVLNAVNQLPEHERAATALFYINGYSMAEVGEFLEVPVSTVKSRLHSARRRLEERTVGLVEETIKQHAPGDRFTEKVRQVLENMPWIGWSHGGPRPPEETMFPACLRAFLEYVDEASDLQGPSGGGHPWHNVYINLMGISGAAFRLLWDDQWQSGNPDMVYMAADPAEPIRRAFRAVGYPVNILHKEAGEERHRQAIIASTATVAARRSALASSARPSAASSPATARGARCSTRGATTSKAPKATSAPTSRASASGAGTLGLIEPCLKTSEVSKTSKVFRQHQPLVGPRHSHLAP